MPVTQITVREDELLALLKERDAARKQITDLQDAMSAMQEAQLSRRVRAFHTKFGHPVRTTPQVPADAEVRFRLRLIGEEFFELLRASLNTQPREDVEDVLDEAEERVFDCINGLVTGCYADEETNDDDEPEDDQIDEPVDIAVAVEVDLPEFVDALVDLAYVIEGGHAILGTHAAPFLAEVQRANMEKDPNGPNGKPVKPEDWKPPQVRRVLIEQGWQP